MANNRKTERHHNGGEQGVLLKTWADSYAEVSKLWEETFLKLQKPLIETTGDLAEKAAELATDASPKQYEEFFNEWTKASAANFGSFLPSPQIDYSKETLEKLVAGAEEASKLYRSWAVELEENSKKTKEILKGQSDTSKYKQQYDAWMKSYDKIFDQMLELSSMENTKEILEKYTGVPDVYLGSFVQVSKLWRESYAKLFEPWVEAVSKLSAKAAELSQGNVSEKGYEEFYQLWMEAYKDTYGKYAESMQPTKESFDSFVQSTDVYLSMYKSWISALENMAQKTNQLSVESTDEDLSGEFYGLWMKMYEKAFGSFFEDMPMQGPMKEMMGPVQAMAKINTETFSRMSQMWTKNLVGAGKE